MEIQIDGRCVRYIDEGQGPEVLLLHGWGAPAQTYRLIIDHLSSRCRVVAPDLPGFGGSQEPPEPWTVDNYVDFTLKFCKAVGLTSPILIGHSYGGRIIIKLMNRPNLSISVPKIILMDAAGIRPARGPKYYIKVYSYKALRRLLPPLAEKMRRKTGSSDYRNASPLMRRTLVLALNEDLTPLLSGISVSTLLIWGENDTATPLPDGQTMEKLIPGSGLVVLKNAGHFSFSDRWGQCSRVLDAFID
ncbi:MAG: alpha/beta hydrolase [Oscillospiraceae bacterium]|nr:alpha/beta hydrolase [Oscillospiraceae bacterium]MDD4413304.1 alpha/beta hydrolase [Oscillospiraceae bacterium]